MDDEVLGVVIILCVIFVAIATITNFFAMPSNSDMRRGTEQRQQMQHYSGDYSYAK